MFVLLLGGASLAPLREFGFERGLRKVDGLNEAEVVAQPAARAVECGVAQAEGRRVAERVVEDEPVAVEREVRNLVRLFQRARVVEHVVVGRDGEQHNVGRVSPDLLAKRE